MRIRQNTHIRSERIAVNVEKTITDLGLAAAQCEFWAAQPEIPYWDRAKLVEQAKAYRDEQVRVLERADRPHPQIETALTLWDALTGPAAQDVYAGCAAIAGVVIVVEILLAVL